MSDLMARPRTINPKGNTRKLSVRVADSVARELEKEAIKKGKTIGAVVRERLEKGAA
jgi:hypothetical protein